MMGSTKNHLRSYSLQMVDNHVIPPGFEPGTHSLEGCCSIQLSYGTDASYRPILNVFYSTIVKQACDFGASQGITTN